MKRRKFLQTTALASLVAVTKPASLLAGSSPSGPMPKEFELEEITIAELQSAQQSGKYSARSLVKKYLDRIDDLDKNGPALNSVIELNPDAMSIAETLDNERKAGRIRGPLHGIPILIKDNIDTADRMMTTAGSLALLGSRPAQDALIRLNKALEYNPGFGDAYVLKSYLYLEHLPNLTEALQAAQSAVKYAPGNPDSSYTLGLVLQRQGQFAAAEQAMRKALEVNPNYSDVYLSLGDLYAEDLKDTSKAVQAYTRYLETGGSDSRARSYLEQNGTVAPPTPQ